MALEISRIWHAVAIPLGCALMIVTALLRLAIKSRARDVVISVVAVAALVLAFTMVVAWLMVGLGKTFALDAVGAWAIENLVYFFVGALAIALLGAGRYSLAGQSVWR